MNALTFLYDSLCVVTALAVLYFAMWKRAGFTSFIIYPLILLWIVFWVLSNEWLGILPDWLWKGEQFSFVIILAINAFYRFRHKQSPSSTPQAP